MIDLRKEFNKILDADGEYTFVIIRHSTDTRCICWRKESDTADPECPNCEGGGWVFNEWIEKCKYFFLTTFRAGQEHDFYAGRTFTNNYTFYAKASPRNRTVKEGDLIYLIGLGEEGEIINPIKRKRKLQIIGSYDFQGQHAKTDFVKIIAKPLTV